MEEEEEEMWLGLRTKYLGRRWIYESTMQILKGRRSTGDSSYVLTSDGGGGEEGVLIL